MKMTKKVMKMENNNNKKKNNDKAKGIRIL